MWRRDRKRQWKKLILMPRDRKRVCLLCQQLQPNNQSRKRRRKKRKLLLS